MTPTMLKPAPPHLTESQYKALATMARFGIIVVNKGDFEIEMLEASKAIELITAWMEAQRANS